ncbi:uncharacterized protein LOC141601417 [Silene latifolia]|uniref:uncharacterized protein LOC141601417 n=1 Tax=Silene latifolia TaxID=37657 RepID=UPI003D783145
MKGAKGNVPLAPSLSQESMMKEVITVVDNLVEQIINLEVEIIRLRELSIVNGIWADDDEDKYLTEHYLVKNTKDDLSVCQLVASSFPHRQALLQALAKLNVADNSTPDDIVNLGGNSLNEEVKKGPVEEDVLRTKAIHEVVTIPGLSLEDEEDPATNISWITKRVKKHVAASPDVATIATDNLTQFTSDDNKEEVEYWNNVVYCFVLGAKPPWEVLHGYIHRIWSKHGIDKVSFLPNRVFLVRFKDIKDKEAVLMAGYHMFDNKPLIVKPWTENIDLLKEDVKLGKCIPKIAGLVGKFIKADNATEEKTRLGFARIMVELKVGQTLPNTVNFLDEHGHVHSINVEYEWKPTICSKCKNIGHEGNNCSKVSQKQQHKAPVKKNWKPISKPADRSSSGNNTTYDSEFPVLQNTKLAGVVLQPTDHNETDSNLPPEKDAVSQQSSSPVQEEVVCDVVCENGNVSHNMFENWSVITNCSLHKGGRVWLIWQPSLFDVMILQYDPQFIHTKVHIKATNKFFFLTMVYAFNDGNDRVDLWHKLVSFASNCHGPWALAGDFNTVISPDERLGGNIKQEDMEDFIDYLDKCGMSDIAATGAFFTWTNKQDVGHRKCSRLDRFLINNDWLAVFPEMTAYFYPEGLLDHNPCVVSNINLGGGKNKSFKYFNMWSLAPNFIEKIQDAWIEELEASAAIYQLNDIQEKLMANVANQELISQEIEALDNVRLLTKARDSFLQQKAKSKWLEEGDINTAFFHGAIKKRCIKNKVIQIEDINGQTCTNTDSIQEAFLEYYKSLLEVVMLLRWFMLLC